MHGRSRHILREVAKNGELSLIAAIELGSRHDGSHADQYPLALLIEDNYLGITITHTPPKDADNMREYSLATMLHMFRLPKNEQGIATYRGITSSGSINPNSERVFIKAKGALYLDQERQKRRDRTYSFIIGFAAGIVTFLAQAAIRKLLGLA